ncbi:MAG TPA: hypothetical protein VGO37_19890 [Steroidobacteraceae bacterium]|jgi:hypothetical protein|nr:hypothetical protein [Steroidobacteraceae bacterium]
MGQSTGEGPSRYVTFAVVMVLHLALVAWLMMPSRAPLMSGSPDQPVEVLFLPSASAAKIHAERFRPLSLSGDTAISIEPPVLVSESSALSPSGSESDGSGPGVDWKAEARRALQAYEIRNREPPNDAALSVSPAEESWWPQARHRPGARYKTANGDWIVWINSSCYQIATSAPGAFAPGATLPQTICTGGSGRPRSEIVEQAPARKKELPVE